jgi:hypothetical protein
MKPVVTRIPDDGKGPKNPVIPNETNPEYSNTS